MTSDKQNTNSTIQNYFHRRQRDIVSGAFFLSLFGLGMAGVDMLEQAYQRKNWLPATTYAAAVAPAKACVETSIPGGIGGRRTDIYDLAAPDGEYIHYNLRSERVTTRKPVTVIREYYGADHIFLKRARVWTSALLPQTVNGRFDTMSTDTYQRLLHTVDQIRVAGASSVNCASQYTFK